MSSSSRPRIVVVQHQDLVPLGLLGPALAQCDLLTLTPGHDQPWPAPADFDALIVLGGTADVRDRDGDVWLAQVGAYLRAAVQAQVPTLGICLGAQLLTTTLGGQVEHAAPGGPERGLVELRMRPEAADDALLGPVVAALGRDVVAPASHEDVVSTLPPEAVWLASSRQYPFQAFRVGSAWGLQFHPEVEQARLASWIARHGGDADAVNARYAQYAEQLGSLASLLGAAFADLARSHRR
ncbi:MAG: type 1 glutamine amidotransferase [Beutenbergiaceae bacterium]